MKSKSTKKIILIFVFVLFIALGLLLYFCEFFPGSNQYKQKLEIQLENSYEAGGKVNGYWWGFNQSKIATIDDTIFTYTYDNSNIQFGNSSETNPYKCEFYYIVEGIKTKFGEALCNRPCNVITDATHNKVYYVVSEPIGEADLSAFDNSSRAKAVLYTYSYNSNPLELNLDKVEIIIPTEENDGAIIRLGVAISENGDLLISYGSYNGYIISYVKAYGQTRWTRFVTLSNNDNHSMMYHFVAISDPTHFYILALQDYNDGQGHTYYQYAKLFTYNGENLTSVYADESPIMNNGYPLYNTVSNNNGWSELVVIDERSSKMANKIDNIVNTRELMLADGKLHIIVQSKKSANGGLVHFHYILENNQLKLLKDDFGILTKYVRLAKANGKLYYITYKIFLSELEIFEVDSGKRVYRKVLSLSNSKGNIYVGKNFENSINVAFIPNEGIPKIFVLEEK